MSLFSNAFLCREEDNVCIWKPYILGIFSTKPFSQGTEDVPAVRLACSLVWRGLARPKVEIFCWLLVAYKVSTADNLRRVTMSESISDLSGLVTWLIIFFCNVISPIRFSIVF